MLPDNGAIPGKKIVLFEVTISEIKALKGRKQPKTSSHPRSFPQKLKLTQQTCDLLSDLLQDFFEGVILRTFEKKSQLNRVSSSVIIYK